MLAADGITWPTLYVAGCASGKRGGVGIQCSMGDGDTVLMMALQQRWSGAPGPCPVEERFAGRGAAPRRRARLKYLNAIWKMCVS